VQNVNGDIVYPRGNEMTDVQTNGKKIIQNCNDVYFLAEDNVLYKVYNKYEVDPSDVSCTTQLTNGKKEIWIKNKWLFKTPTDQINAKEQQ